MLTIEILGRAYAPEGQQRTRADLSYIYDLDHLESQATGFSVQLRKSYGIEKRASLMKKSPCVIVDTYL